MEQVLTNSRVDKLTGIAERASQVSVVLLFLFLPISTSLTTVFFFLSIALVLCSGDLVKNLKLIFSQPLVWMLCAFYSMFIIGSCYSHASHASQLAVLTRYSRYVFCVFLIPVFLKERVRNWALNAFLFSSILTLTLVFLKASHIFIIRPDGDTLTIFKDHIDTGFILVVAAYIALLFSLKAGDKKIKHFYYYLVFMIAVATFYLGYSRSAYLVFAALSALFVYQRFGWRYVFIVLAITPFIAGVLFFVSPIFKSEVLVAIQGYHQFQKIGVRSHSSAGERMTFYTNGLRAVKEHWLIGSGSGSMNYVTSYLDKDFQRKIMNLHNEYLNISVQFGLLGLLVLLSLFYCVWRTSLNLPFYYNYLMQGVLVTTMSGSLINSWLMDSTEGHFFAIMVILCLAAGLSKRVANES